MAKKAKRLARGGGSMTDQIASLEGIVKPKGVRAAKEILDGYDPGVIKLAFKYVRQRERAAGPQGLGSRIENLLAQMPPSEATMMRGKLLEAKAAQAEA